MNGKQVGMIIALIFAIPTLIGLSFLIIKISNDLGNPENLEEGINIIVEDAIP